MLYSVETITVRRQEKLTEKANERHAEEDNVWKEDSRKSANSHSIDVKVAKGDSMKIEQNLMLARLEKPVRALRTLVNTNIERKLTSTSAMAKIRELFTSGCSIDC